MTTSESKLFRQLRERQQQNVKLYSNTLLPAWLSPIVSLLGFHFASMSLIISFLLALASWTTISSIIIDLQKAVLFL